MRGGKIYSIDWFCEHLVCSLDIVTQEIPKGNARNFRILQSFASHTFLSPFHIDTQLFVWLVWVFCF